VDKLRRQKAGPDYVSICSPNYLHDAHIRFALRNQAHAICEKPLVINPWNVDALADIERETGKKINTVLQLRLHPAIRELRRRVAAAPAGQVFDVDLAYITSRGRWYAVSWKGDTYKSGGIATNIGIHFFDMLGWVFGARRSSVVHVERPDAAAGYMEFARARVRWFLSINPEHLPAQARETSRRTYRSITLGGEELEFSEGFTDLHTQTYRHVLEEGGFGLEDARPSIEIVHAIRGQAPAGLVGDFHPFCLAAR
jgi:UDP-N-acetyl-2-amino-2-deoxyglucuronate dehydrogenase